MKMKIILSMTCIGIIAAGMLTWACLRQSTSSRTQQAEHVVTIGILQTASHPALDQAREGFVKTVKNALHDNVRFVIRNAQGSIANSHVIAQSFHAHDDIDAIFAIATPAAQAIAAVEKKKPIFIAAVTDPKQLDAHSNTNICGGSDKINIPATITMIKQLLPTITTIALLAHTGDTNTEEELAEMECELEKAQLIPLRIGFTAEADVPAVILSACGKADAILTPNYNIIASGMPLVASIALKNKKPLIACYPSAVQQGALVAHGIDYTVNGEQAGECAIQVFVHNKMPHELPIEQQQGTSIINKNVADALGILIPTSLDHTINQELP